MTLRICTILLLISSTIYGQGNENLVSGQDNRNRVITSAVTFLNIAPDARSSALGFSGVASTPDQNSIHWNNAKLAFIEKDFSASFSYLPWLKNLTNDMFLGYLSGAWKMDDIQSVGISFRYFDRGDFDVLDDQANIVGDFSPNELAFDATYARKLSDKISLGLTFRYILSNISDVTDPNNSGSAESSVAVDLGFYYTKPISSKTDLSLGAHISNFGPKIEYIDRKYFLPVNLRLGSTIRQQLDEINSLSLSLDFNKLMVPTPPLVARDPQTGDYIIVEGRDADRSLMSGVFGSFSDAPDGFSEEMKEISVAVGVEYWYKNLASLRMGYFGEHDEKGNRKIITTGLGFRYKEFGLDFTYLIPTQSNHPLGETLQLTLLAGWSKP